MGDVTLSSVALCELEARVCACSSGANIGILQFSALMGGEWCQDGDGGPSPQPPPPFAAHDAARAGEGEDGDGNGDGREMRTILLITMQEYPLATLTPRREVLTWLCSQRRSRRR